MSLETVVTIQIETFAADEAGAPPADESFVVLGGDGTQSCVGSATYGVYKPPFQSVFTWFILPETPGLAY